MYGMQILAKRVSLFDYELVDGDQRKRLIAFGKFAGGAAMIDLLRGLGQSMIYHLRLFSFQCLFY